ncbi:MAG: hypothetical protein ACLFTK_12705, partial [Anaerolineales bacterium]
MPNNPIHDTALGWQVSPGPPTRRADFHFLYLAPGVNIEYFFDAARVYWQTFRTIVVYDLSLVSYIPGQYSIAITSLARSDT